MDKVPGPDLENGVSVSFTDCTVVSYRISEISRTSNLLQRCFRSMLIGFKL